MCLFLIKFINKNKNSANVSNGIMVGIFKGLFLTKYYKFHDTL